MLTFEELTAELKVQTIKSDSESILISVSIPQRDEFEYLVALLDAISAIEVLPMNSYLGYSSLSFGRTDGSSAAT